MFNCRSRRPVYVNSLRNDDWQYVPRLRNEQVIGQINDVNTIQRPQYIFHQYPPRGSIRYVKRVVSNYLFLEGCLAAIQRNLSEFDLNYTQNYLYELSEFSMEYNTVARKFGKRNFDISEIKKIENPFILLHYELRKQQYRNRDVNVTERLLFHGTKEANVMQICMRNFNWRLRGECHGMLFISLYYFLRI